MKYKHLSVIFLMMLCAPLLQAREFRVAQLPNGARYQCMNCHLNPLGGAVNIFGLDVFRNLNGQNVNWPAVCPLDSDADGFTNGVELGDPNCVWVNGPAMSTSMLSNPGDRFSKPILPMDMQLIDQALPMDMQLIDQSIEDQMLDIVDLFLVDAYQGDQFMTNGGSYIQDLALPPISDQMLNMTDQGMMAMLDLSVMPRQDQGEHQDALISIDHSIGDQANLIVDSRIVVDAALMIDATLNEDQAMIQAKSIAKSGCQQSKLPFDSLIILLCLSTICLSQSFQRHPRASALLKPKAQSVQTTRALTPPQQGFPADNKQGFPADNKQGFLADNKQGFLPSRMI
jgi:hypothetical protein